jgi:hypothetical protein
VRQWFRFSDQADPGRLFYTPVQRAQLEAARARNVTQIRQAAQRTQAPRTGTL